MNKAWRRIDNKLLLYKRGNIGAANLDKEHFAEGISSEIGSLLELNCIPYWTDKWHNQNCSVCEIFTNKDKGYLPVRYFLEKVEPNKKKWGFANIIEWIPKEFRQDFLDMIVFDYIIENRDRHFSNFGFLVNNHNGIIKGLAPIFDNGYSLLNFEMEEDLINYDYSKSMIGTFDIDNKLQAKEVIMKNPKKYKNWVKVLANNIEKNRFQRIPYYNFQIYK